MQKFMSFLKVFLNSLALAGVFMLVIGLYYYVIRAGIPYQDPPLELQIKYAVNQGIGKELMMDGFLLGVFGGTVRVLLEVVERNRMK